MSYFTTAQTKALERIRVLQEFVGEQQLYDKPCVLFDQHLNALTAFITQLQIEIARVKEAK